MNFVLTVSIRLFDHKCLDYTWFTKVKLNNAYKIKYAKFKFCFMFEKICLFLLKVLLSIPCIKWLWHLCITMYFPCYFLTSFVLNFRRVDHRWLYFINVHTARFSEDFFILLQERNQYRVILAHLQNKC